MVLLNAVMLRAFESFAAPGWARNQARETLQWWWARRVRLQPERWRRRGWGGGAGALIRLGCSTRMSDLYVRLACAGLSAGSQGRRVAAACRCQRRDLCRVAQGPAGEASRAKHLPKDTVGRACGRCRERGELLPTHRVCGGAD